MPHSIIKSINKNKWTISILEYTNSILTLNNHEIELNKKCNIGEFVVYEIKIDRQNVEQQINYI
jgi:hypothetical protein